MLFSLAITTLSHYTATHAEGSLCVSLCGVTHSFEQHHISCISSFVLRRTLLTPLPVKQQNVSPNGIHSNIWIMDLDLILIAQFYFVIGMFIRKADIDSNYMNQKFVGYVVCFIIAILISIWGNKNGIVVDYPSKNFRYPCAEVVVALASTFIVAFLSMIICKYINFFKRPLAFCGKNSLGIMIFHFVFFKVFFVLLYANGVANQEDITNVILTTELSNRYWFTLTVFALIGSLLLWCTIVKIPVLRFCLGKDTICNNKLSSKIPQYANIFWHRKHISTFISSWWVKSIKFISEHKVFSLFSTLFVVLVVIPLYRTGIIINDELQARSLAMQGFTMFYQTEFAAWINQGRALAAPINSLTKYLGFIGADFGTSFRILQIIILLAIVFLFGLFINRLLKNKNFAFFSSLIALTCMPITFEHTSPNAFIGFLGVSFGILIVSFILYIDYIEEHKKGKAICSMLLFFVAQMSYEALVTYVVLYFMIVLGKTGIKNIKKNLKLYLFPLFTSIFYLVCYFMSSIFSPSAYEGNQFGFDNIIEPLIILKNLFLASIPGFYVFSSKYKVLKLIYFNLETFDYIRIILLAISFLIVCIKVAKTSTEKVNNQQETSRIANTYIILCGICYMVLPGLPISISSMYQGNVGNEGFIALPVTFFEYFAAVFVLAYILWHICRFVGHKYYVIVASLLCLLVVNVQQMNDIFSKEQNNNFNWLVNIESFLQSETVKGLDIGEYSARDLYQQKNALAIHNNYWTTYCNDVLGVPIQLCNETSTSKLGDIYYDGDNFVIVTPQKLTVMSFDKEDGPKAVQIADNSYILMNFENETMDGSFYVYTLYTALQRYCSNYGYQEDGWLAKESSFMLTTGEKGEVYLTLYYPGTNINGKTIHIFVNGEKVSESNLVEQYLNVDIATQPNEIIELKIECNFEYENKGEDIRPIAIILSELIVS